MKSFLLAALALSLFACQSKEEILHDQYVIEGRIQYENNCANCHQSNGQGLRNLYPSISKSTLSAPELARLIKQGRKSATGYMPANPKLQAIDIAEIITFMRHEWGKNEQTFTFDSTRIVLKGIN
jgi:mono/diheme cytochrome c family protein